MINQTCPLLLKDVYSYDIQAAYPSILSKQNYNFKDINLNDKTERSIFLGKQQIDNSNLSEFLTESVNSLVRYYLQENNVSEEETITIQKDGFIITKMLNITDEFITMQFREMIDFLIITPDRKKFLYSSNDKITVKGISFYYSELNKIYQMFSCLNFYEKSMLFGQMENIKNQVLQSDDKSLFLIPKDEKSFIVSTYKGNIEIKDPDMISLSDINKNQYFDHFFKEFLQSIFLENY